MCYTFLKRIDYKFYATMNQYNYFVYSLYLSIYVIDIYACE